MAKTPIIKGSITTSVKTENEYASTKNVRNIVRGIVPLISMRKYPGLDSFCTVVISVTKAYPPNQIKVVFRFCVSQMPRLLNNKTEKDVHAAAHVKSATKRG
jgi:hypothetical protein